MTSYLPPGSPIIPMHGDKGDVNIFVIAVADLRMLTQIRVFYLQYIFPEGGVTCFDHSG